MEDNPTVGYALGIIEGYLESLVSEGQAGADTVLEYLKVVEQAYKAKVQECLAQETKLNAIQLNLSGWHKI